MPKYYKPKNIAKVAAEYTVTAGVAAGSFLLGQPWVMGAVAFAAVGLQVAMHKTQKKFFENSLVQYPASHKYSPHLGEIAKDLYTKSGLKAENYPVYDFKPKNKFGQKKNFMQVIFDSMAKTHNAASVRFGKPIIMISEPLLKLLDEKEQKAVLAHEFAHAAARHQSLMSPQRLISGVAGLNNFVTQTIAMVAAGWEGLLSAIAVQGISSTIARKLSGAGFKSDDELSLPQLAKKKKFEKIGSGVGIVAAAAVLTYFSPAFLGIFAAVKGMSIGSKLAGSALSRSSEYQADTGAVALGADPLALITSLRKITIVQERSIAEAFDGNVPKSGTLTKKWRQLNTDHPSLKGRVKNLSKIARKQGVAEELISAAANDPINVPADNNMPYSVVRSLMR